MAAGSKTLRFLAVLADVGPVPTYVVARRSGLTMRDCSHISSSLVHRGRASRLKPKLSEGGGYYRYFLSESQLKDFYRVAGVNPGFGIDGVGVVDVVDRLHFLRMLKDRSVYHDSPVLAAIIGDYERTMGNVRE